MKVRVYAAMLAFLVISGALRQPAEAQFGMIPGISGKAAATPARNTGSAAYYTAQAGTRSRMQASPTAGYYEPQAEQQPQTQSLLRANPQPIQPQPAATSDGHTVEALPLEGAYSVDGYGGEYFGAGCDDSGCCNSCGGDGNSCDCFCPPGWNMARSGESFFTADYLFVRAHFSDAIAYLNQDESQQGLVRDDFRQLNFQYESSYRFGGGYRLCDCGDEIRFMFTRLSSNASEIAPEGTFVPYDVIAEPGGQTYILADVDVKSFDVSFAKKIPLGSQSCGGCGDACGCGCGGGCGDACGCASCSGGCGCPVWELTWSGGFRFADADWDRTYLAVDENESLTASANAAMTYRGGGPRIGLEGRRYFFEGGMMSVYMKGDISLLMGDLDLISRRSVDNGTAPDFENIQTLHCRHIIPVTELETGLTGQLTNNTTLTAGYLFSAWHDLGFRDQFDFPTALATSYDDANILGFDGFFARLEVAF
jgi:hypothetical protein